MGNDIIDHDYNMCYWITGMSEFSLMPFCIRKTTR